MNKDNKKAKVLLIITIVVIILLVGGTTFAFFQTQNDGGKEAGVNVTTNTVDKFSFMITNDIILDDINQDTFNVAGQNKTASSDAIAILKANNKTNTATEHYSLYLDIENNNFEYSTPEQTPELILSISVTTDDGIHEPVTRQITELEGFEYVTVEGVSGFDITTVTDLIRIAEDYEITADPDKTDTWNIKVTFVCLEGDQYENTDKTFNGKLKIQKDRIIYLADHIKSLYTIDGENALYLHDTDLANGAGDNSYRYTGDEAVLTEKGSQTYTSVYGEETSLIKSRNATLEEYATIIWGYESVDALIEDWGGTSLEELYSWLGATTEEEFIAANGNPQVYYLDYDNNKTVIYPMQKAKMQAEKDGYAKYLVNNFVCFGTDIKPCPENNLYRIIGVFNEDVIGADGNATGEKKERVKLIKNTSIEGIKWDDTNKNSWSSATLNTATLNGTYLTGLGDYADKIAKTRWHVGGGTENQLQYVIPKIAYQNEGGTPVNNTAYDAKIGLMYVSDYGFAASPENWTLELGYKSDGSYYGKVIDSNWMYLGIDEWTISPSISSSNQVHHISVEGCLSSYSVNYARGNARPSFYLKTDVTLSDGDGSITNPYTIGID